MPFTTDEGRAEILTELGRAIGELGAVVEALGGAYELVDEQAGDRLEEALFGPAQRALARARTTSSAFAARSSLPVPAVAGPSSSGARDVRSLLDDGAEAAEEADGVLADLQDSMLPVEVGDAELRAGLAEVRQIVGPLPDAIRRFMGTVGR